MDLRERGRQHQRHPWESARLSHVLRVLDRDDLLAGARSLLDAGSGDSFVAAELQRRYPQLDILCWDRHYTAADLALPPAGLSRTMAIPDKTFDLVLALDVIEHVEEHVQFLVSLRQRLRPGGAMLVTVPAYQRLFSNHDHYLGHHRRYSGRSLRDTLEAAGWRVGEAGSFFAVLLPLRALSVLAETLTRSGRTPSQTQVATRVRHLGTWSRGRLPTQLIADMLRLDAALGRQAARRGIPYPGLSLYALAHPSEAR